MGALCCCFHVPDVEETAVSNNSSNRNCLNNFVQNLKSKYGAVFGSGEMHASPSSDPAGASSSNPSVEIINSSSTNGYPQSQNNALIRGRDKGAGHSRVGPEPRGGHICQLIPNLLSRCRKPIGSKECGAEFSVKYFSSEYDDDCPTCLEEYTPENPKIITKCSHHYHLGCILEWMERSETCPVCMKKMEFDETT